MTTPGPGLKPMRTRRRGVPGFSLMLSGAGVRLAVAATLSALLWAAFFALVAG